jgi:hypothetical protein
VTGFLTSVYGTFYPQGLSQQEESHGQLRDLNSLRSLLRSKNMSRWQLRYRSLGSELNSGGLLISPLVLPPTNAREPRHCPSQNAQQPEHSYETRSCAAPPLYNRHTRDTVQMEIFQTSQAFFFAKRSSVFARACARRLGAVTDSITSLLL